MRLFVRIQVSSLRSESIICISFHEYYGNGLGQVIFFIKCAKYLTDFSDKFEGHKLCRVSRFYKQVVWSWILDKMYVSFQKSWFLNGCPFLLLAHGPWEWGSLGQTHHLFTGFNAGHGTKGVYHILMRWYNKASTGLRLVLQWPV